MSKDITVAVDANWNVTRCDESNVETKDHSYLEGLGKCLHSGIHIGESGRCGRIDSFPEKALKLGKPALVKPLTKLVNNSLTTSFFSK